MKEGIHSIAVLPLIISGVVVGLLAMYARESEFFHDDEMKLLTQLACDISFAINHLDQQAQLAYIAYYDRLTGLANDRLFLDRASQYILSGLPVQTCPPLTALSSWNLPALHSATRPLASKAHRPQLVRTCR